MTVDPAARPLHFQGQYIGPADLDAIVRYGADHAARHTLGAHTWGIGAGLAIREFQSAGAVSYWIQPGVAWDGFGRTLLVPTPIQITADRLRSAVYDPVNDARTGPGQLLNVWLRYAEDATTPPAPGFAECDDGGFARAIEHVEIIVRNFATELETQQLVDVGGRAVAPGDAVGAWYPPTSNPLPVIEDGSVAFQRFPGPNDASRWLVPIGVVRWKVARPGAVGSAGTFMPLQPDDLEIARQRRRLVGVVAGSVLGTEGTLRLRPRELPPPSLWTSEPIWLESTTRLDGDLHLFSAADENNAGGIDFRDALGDTAGRRLRISRVKTDAGADMRVQLGTNRDAGNRLVVGTESTTIPPVFSGSVVLTSSGRMGVGTTSPQTPLHVAGQPTQEQASDITAHVAIVENRSTSPGADVLALRVRTSANQVSAGNNFITFFAGTDAIGCIEADGIGVRLTSGSADFAESVPAADGEQLTEGDRKSVV